MAIILISSFKQGELEYESCPGNLNTSPGSTNVSSACHNLYAEPKFLVGHYHKGLMKFVIQNDIAKLVIICRTAVEFLEKGLVF